MPERTKLETLKVTAWGRAIEHTRFRNKLLAGLVLLACILITLPRFFQFIEARNGVVLNDLLLQWMGPADLSIPLFIIIWSTTALFIIRSLFQPVLFLNAVYCLSFLCLVRMLTIYLVPLDPPATIIAIKDPLTSLTYGGKDVFMTKDLFFSGHTSNMLMLALCFERKTDRWIGMVAALLVGVFVLVQHAHYTIDVVAAFFITMVVVKFGKKISGQSGPDV